MKRTIAAALLIPAILALGASSARAEPVAITWGYLIFDYEGDFFRFTGPDAAFNGSEEFNIAFPRITAPSCSLCRPGDIVDASFRTPGEVDLGTGTATYGGVTYQNVDWRGSWSMDVQAVAFPNTTADTVFPSAPFVFTGSLRGVSGGDELFSVDLAGRGLWAQPYFRRNGVYEWEEGRVGYGFSEGPESPAPVPEPATMGLVGAGLALSAWRARRRRQASISAG